MIHDSFSIINSDSILEFHDYARADAIRSLGLAFQYIPNKLQAWNDLRDGVMLRIAGCEIVLQKLWDQHFNIYQIDN